MELVSIQEASDRLGISIVSLHGNANTKYEKFRHREEGKKLLFDIQGFEHREALREELREKTKLLVEYLRHIEGMGYGVIAKLAGIDSQNVYSGIYGYGTALKIVRSVAYSLPFHLLRFDEYYGYKTAPIVRRIPINRLK